MQEGVEKRIRTVLRSSNDEVSVAARNSRMPMFLGHF